MSGPLVPSQSFETAQRELESIVERLERGDASLDEAIALWQRGEELYRFCKQRLDSAQASVEEFAAGAESARRLDGEAGAPEGQAP